MRYSAMRLLDWQRNHNTRPVELAHKQKMLTYTIAELIKHQNKSNFVSPYLMARSILSTLGKGGDNGQRIRDQILEIMHRRNIKRREVNYYEQWHQKLHNNTTPDDIGICEAIIVFLESGSMERYWDVLHAHGITRERLASFERPITLEPYYIEHLAGDMKDYLGVLKAVHGATDVSFLVGQSMAVVNDQARHQLQDVLNSLHSPDRLDLLKKVTEARKSLHKSVNWNDSHATREASFGDVSLESFARQILEGVIHNSMDLTELFEYLWCLLENVSLITTHREFQACFNDWGHFTYHLRGQLGDVSSVRLLKSAADRIARAIGLFVDEYNSVIDPKARFLGKQFGVDPSVVDIFTEEIIRGSVMFAVSSILRKIDLQLRERGQLSPWQIISPIDSAQGRVQIIQNLRSVQYEEYKEPTLILVKQIGGEEEVPKGAIGVITQSAVDVLAHISVRARNTKSLLAICFSEELYAQIERYDGRLVQINNSGASIEVTEIQTLTLVQSKDQAAIQVRQVASFSQIIIGPDRYTQENVGGKSLNCGILAKELGQDIKVPASITIPYNSLETVLESPDNQDQKSQLEAIYKEIDEIQDKNEVANILLRAKDVIQSIQLPNQYQSDLIEGLQSIGLSASHIQEAWNTIKQVWASKFNERAYIATYKAGISTRDINMAVLCQQVVKADYAFVLHTKDPSTNDENLIYGELVIGMGEALVGAYQGRAFGFNVHKQTGAFEIHYYPNKSVAVRGEGYIFRSDSNSEDLPGFAGAGLFDSVTINPVREEVIEYKDERISNDRGFQEWVIQQLKTVALQVEKIFGSAQDIEGVLSSNEIYVVQSRPQV